MEIKQFIEKAIEGGYDAPYSWEEQSWQGDHGKLKAILDPLAWQAVGKVESSKEAWLTTVSWKANMVGMANALAEGKTIDDFLATL